ncbi:hypothetical protein GM658_28530 [Pseudoduganella eburnea]|uniref:Uncharacterized protein n=1 Tax=Massilia eburnea TaxID=1776165 RepID=A0A6L6QRP7_9BURK|nr:hypothetical protein [Massilia eburnea]
MEELNAQAAIPDIPNAAFRKPTAAEAKASVDDYYAKMRNGTLQQPVIDTPGVATNIGSAEGFFIFNPLGQAAKGYAESAYNLVFGTTIGGINLAKDAYGFANQSLFGPEVGLMGDVRLYEPQNGIVRSVMTKGGLATAGDIAGGAVTNLPGVGTINAIYRKDPGQFGASLPVLVLAGAGGGFPVAGEAGALSGEAGAAANLGRAGATAETSTPWLNNRNGIGSTQKFGATSTAEAAEASTSAASGQYAQQGGNSYSAVSYQGANGMRVSTGPQLDTYKADAQVFVNKAAQAVSSVAADSISTTPNAGASEALNAQSATLDTAKHYCTDCAFNLRNAAGGQGKVVIFSDAATQWPAKYDWGMGGGVRVPSAQGPVDFAYHSVYTDGRYFYDPLLSNTPIPQAKYIDMLKSLNPNGTSWRIYEPDTPNPAVPQLQKGGF